MNGRRRAVPAGKPGGAASAPRGTPANEDDVALFYPAERGAASVLRGTPVNGRRRGGRKRTPGRDLWDALRTASGGRRRGGRKRTPGRSAQGVCEGGS